MDTYTDPGESEQDATATAAEDDNPEQLAGEPADAEDQADAADAAEDAGAEADAGDGTQAGQ